MKNSFLLIVALALFSSCAKEEFSTNKGSQVGSINPIVSTSNKLCSQHTLVSPKVDILMLWDNSTSFNIVTPETRASMGQLISSVSEKFDYHILSVPLISSSTNTLAQAQLVAKDTTNLSSTAMSILKSKDVAAAELAFTSSSLPSEYGVDRAIKVLESNRSNGIFRNDAYTIIVVISNEDDDNCEAPVSEGGSGFSNCSASTWQSLLQTKITKLLCLRGNTGRDCSGSSVSNPFNSTMMRFINISPLSSCTTGNNKINYRYRLVAKELYEASYTNDWPTSNDHIAPDVAGAPDSYNLCSINFSHIFDGVNATIKQTLINHVYDYWPVAGSTTSLDPDTLKVVRSDGKVLQNRTGESNPSNGFAYVGSLTNQPTRVLPVPGETFTGKMIRLFGVNGNDRIVYPDCLTVTFDAEKSNFGYIYMKYGEPVVSTIEVRINGALVPQSSSNGWDYMGLQYTASLDPNLKVVDLPSEASSGYFVRLNGSYKIQNSGNSVNIQLFYNSKNQ